MAFTFTGCCVTREYSSTEFPQFLHDISFWTSGCCLKLGMERGIVSDCKGITMSIIIKHLHLSNPFDTPIDLPNQLMKHRIYNGADVMFNKVTTNFLTRVLYTETCPIMPIYQFFKLAVLAGVCIPNQTLCCAASLKTVPLIKDNPYGPQFTWFDYILRLDPSAKSVRVTKDGKPIVDDVGTCILTIVSDDNVRRLLKRIHSEGVTELVDPSEQIVTALGRLPKLKFIITKINN